VRRARAQVLFYPLELAWTRLAADTSRRGAPRTYQGLLHCLQTTARLEGVPGAAPRCSAHASPSCACTRKKVRTHAQNRGVPRAWGARLEGASALRACQV